MHTTLEIDQAEAKEDQIKAEQVLQALEEEFEIVSSQYEAVQTSLQEFNEALDLEKGQLYVLGYYETDLGQEGSQLVSDDFESLKQWL